jgi:hypothetical protein
VSGVLSTVVFGLQTARTSLLSMSETSLHANHAVWSEIGFVATSFIFVLAGVKSHAKVSEIPPSQLSVHPCIGGSGNPGVNGVSYRGLWRPGFRDCERRCRRGGRGTISYPL